MQIDGPLASSYLTPVTAVSASRRAAAEPGPLAEMANPVDDAAYIVDLSPAARADTGLAPAQRQGAESAAAVSAPPAVSDAPNIDITA